MRKLLAVSVILLLAAGTAAAQGKNSGACDRACLEGMVNQYLSAMVAHDPSKAPFAKNLKFTENAVKLPPTEGLWFTSTGLGDFKFYVSDLKAGQVGFVGVVKEHDKPVLLGLRLKMRNSYEPTPNSMPIMEVFKIKNGNIRDTIAVATHVPYGLGDGWSEPLFK
jgi:hypothetical protein